MRGGTTLCTMAGLRAVGIASTSQLVSCWELGGQGKGRTQRWRLGWGEGQREAPGRHLDLELPRLSGLVQRRPENIKDQEVVDSKADA